ncbi:dihydrofolate reductase family protein [Pseudanabaena sp. PCC 6802]|uniref:dihydrofolate reductase family protein n=1 Tax=Pseudanabaena sp. PCC 6802 TaxID=118173 RepID=UPI00034B1298|nr:dihydrofolate reductase family protein [Pseudanabaena sp. PCC 6802]
MRQLKYLVACTVDRFIAGRDDSFDFFLMEGEHMTDIIQEFPETMPAHLHDLLGIAANNENKHFDTVLMGRRTYEIGQKIGITNPYPQMQQYLISRSLQASPDPNINLVSTDPVTLVRELKQQPGKDIWLCGGGNLATTLFPAIDAMILKVHPVLLGTGIPLLSGAIKPTPLEITSSKIYNNGCMLLHYRLKH